MVSTGSVIAMTALIVGSPGLRFSGLAAVTGPVRPQLFRRRWGFVRRPLAPHCGCGRTIGYQFFAHPMAPDDDEEMPGFFSISKRAEKTEAPHESDEAPLRLKRIV